MPEVSSSEKKTSIHWTLYILKLNLKYSCFYLILIYFYLDAYTNVNV